jgi:hypothetical protein
MLYSSTGTVLHAVHLLLNTPAHADNTAATNVVDLNLFYHMT